MDDVQELVRRAMQGDAGAFERLVDSRKERATQLAWQILGDWEEARDVAQLAFVKIWQRLATFDPRYPFDVWLRRIVTNQAIDHYRRGRSRHEAIGRAAREAARAVPAGGGPAPHRPLSGDEVRALFEEAAATLPAQQRAVFVLREVEDLSPQEIAETLHITESTVRNHLFKARHALQEFVRRKYPEYLPRGQGERS